MTQDLKGCITKIRITEREVVKGVLFILNLLGIRPTSPPCIGYEITLELRPIAWTCIPLTRCRRVFACYELYFSVVFSVSI